MNRKLIDPFNAVALPEIIEEYLDYGAAKTCAFNRRGTLLATGTEDGYIIIWDFETRGVAKVLPGHSVQAAADGSRPTGIAATITSLAWSRNGRHLLSGSLDKRVMLWDVLLGEQVCEVSLASGVTRVSLSPRKPYTAVASLITTAPVLIDLDSKAVTPLASIDFKGGDKSCTGPEVTNMATGVALLSKSGSEALLGQLRGIITIYDTATHKVLDVVKLPAPVKVMSMSLSRQGKLLLTNCSDKVVRMYEVKQRSADMQGLDGQQLKAALANAEVGGTGSLLHSQDASILQLSPITFHNAVERNPWRSVVFSGDLEWVVGAVASKSDHRLYVWNRYYGKLEKILEGVGDQSAVDVAWHPCKPVLVSLSGTGRVYIWAQVHNEYWSAFAPDFQELDENVEYVEQEDEFDINQKPVANKSNADDTGNEDEQVDVVTREKVVVFSSDEEDDQAGEEPLHWLPAEVNLIEDGGAPGDGQPAKEATSDQEEGSDESSDADEDQDAKADDIILDKPRDRKRRVRFEEFFASDEEYSDGDPTEPEPLSAPATAAAAGRGRGRAGGRRGRPPKYGGVGTSSSRGAGSNSMAAAIAGMHQEFGPAPAAGATGLVGLGSGASIMGPRPVGVLGGVGALTLSGPGNMLNPPAGAVGIQQFGVPGFVVPGQGMTNGAAGMWQQQPQQRWPRGPS